MATYQRRNELPRSAGLQQFGGPGSGPHPGGGEKQAPHLAPSIEHQGVIYHRTGKTGTDSRSGEKSAEFESHTKEGDRTGSRVWVTESGKVTRD